MVSAKYFHHLPDRCIQRQLQLSLHQQIGTKMIRIKLNIPEMSPVGFGESLPGLHSFIVLDDSNKRWYPTKIPEQ